MTFKDLPIAMRKLVLQELLTTCTHEELFLAHTLSDQLLLTRPTLLTHELLRNFHPKLCPASRMALGHSPTSVQMIDFITWLPAELIDYILLFLDVKSIVNFGYVSRHWNKFTSESRLWKKLCLRDFANAPSLQENPSSTVASTSASLVPFSARPVDWKQKYVDLYLTHTNWRSGNYHVKNVNESLGQAAQNHTRQSIFLSFDEQRAVSVSRNASGRVWSLLNGQMISILDGHEGMITSAKMNKRYIVTGAVDSSVRVWCANSGKPPPEMHPPNVL